MKKLLLLLLTIFIGIYGLKAQLLQDGFENYDDFIIAGIGNWTMIDNDGGTSWGANDFDFTNEGYVGSFIVFNSSSTTPEATGWEAHSGSKSLICFDSGASGTTTPNDDWIISEEFTVGAATTVSLWLKSITDAYGLERYNIYLMNGVTDADVVERLNTGTNYDEAPTDWTQVNYDISSHSGDVLRLGIQCVSDDAFALLIDDIYVGDTYTTTFTVTDGTNPLENANVSIIGNDLTTDASGQASIDLTDGNYQVVTSLPGYINDTTDFTVAGTAADVDITLNLITYNVTFNVDMTDSIASGFFVEGTDQLWLAGNMNGWTMPGDDAAYEMNESATNDIYTVTIPLSPGDYEYKYFKIVGGTSSWDNGEWDGDPNRTFTVADADLTINDVFGNISASVKDISKDGIKVFPNPSNGVFNINVDNNYNLEVFDITGRIINTRTLNENTSIKLDNGGVYFLRFSNEKGSYTQKVIVQ